MIMVRLYVTPFTDIFIHNTYLRTENTVCRNHYSEYNNYSDAWVLEHFINFVSVIIGITLVILLKCILSG